MKKTIICITLSFVSCFAFSQCGPYSLGSINTSCTSVELSVSGTSIGSQIVWQRNGTPFDTLYVVQIEADSGITVAGGNGSGSAANQFTVTSSVFVDSSGNLYVGDVGNARIQKFSIGSTSATNGITVAGGNGSGSAANQIYPYGVCVDNSGNIYVADAYNNRIQEFPAGSTSATNGITVAGGNGQGSSANQLDDPYGLYVDNFGSIYVADYYNNRIQKFPAGSTSSTSGTTVAGGNGGGSGANQLNGPWGVYVDASGNIYVADRYNNRIQKFPVGSTSATSAITIAGGNGSGNAANQLNYPYSVYGDAAGNIYVADENNARIQKFPKGSTSATNGITVAGGNGGGSSANQLYGPDGVCVDGNGNIYIADNINYRVQKWAQTDTSSILVTSTGLYSAIVTDTLGCIASSDSVTLATLSPTLFSFYPISAGKGDTVIIKGHFLSITLSVTFGDSAASSFSVLNDSTISAIIGNGASGLVKVYDSCLYDSLSGFIYLGTTGHCGPYTVTVTDSSCTSFVITVSGASAAQQIIWNLNGTAFDTVFGSIEADSGITVAQGPGGLGLSPSGLYVDGAGNIYVADGNNNRIEKFPFGSTYATIGTIVAGGNGNGSGANQLNNPSAVFVDGTGNIYVADADNERIQKFPAGSTSATNGITVAGGNGGGNAANQLNYPDGIYIDGTGNIYVADYVNDRIQKFPSNSTSATNGVTVAGGNGHGSAPNQVEDPNGIYVDASGNIYVSDPTNARIQKFPAGSTSATDGTTVAGGNGGGSAANQLSVPWGVYVDGTGDIYVADEGNYRIQKFPAGSTSATNGVTVAGGNGQGFAANQFWEVTGVYVDGSGDIIVSDFGNGRVQEWAPPSTINVDTSIQVTFMGSYSATVTDRAGCEAPSNAVDALCNGITTVNADFINIYPNPTNSTINISLGSAVYDANIKVISTTGQTISDRAHQSGSAFTLDMSQQASGIYYLEISSGDGTSRQKFVKM